MSVEFRHERLITLSGFVADPSPVLVEPAAAKIFRLAERPPSGQLFTTGNQIFFDFRTAGGAPVLTATVDWQVWFRDVKSMVWTNAEPETGTLPYDAWITDDIRNADVFAQITAVGNLGSAASLIVRMTEV